MEANQESFRSTSNSSFSTGDHSSLLNHGQTQAQKAGNDFFYHRKAMILSQSKLLLRAAAQRESADVYKPPWHSNVNAALSSAKSSQPGSFTGLKGRLKSFIACESSSLALSEPDQSRENSISCYRTPLLPFSCNQSFECYQSGTETMTRTYRNGEGLCCSESKEIDAWADNGRVLTAHSEVPADYMTACDHGESLNSLDKIESTGRKLGVDHRASTDSMIAFQHTGPLDSRVLSGHRVPSSKIQALDLLVYAAIQVGLLGGEDDENYDAPPEHAKRFDCTNSVACHEGAFPVHLSSPILRKRAVRRARSAFNKQVGGSLLHRLGISSSSKASEKKVDVNVEKDDKCIIGVQTDIVHQQSKTIQYTRRKTSKVFPERVVVHDKTDISERLYMENRDGHEPGGLQASPSKGVQVKVSQCKPWLKQQNLDMSISPGALGPRLKPIANAVRSRMCKDLSQVVESSRGDRNYVSEESCRESNSDAEAQQIQPSKNGGLLTRTQMGPVIWPSQDCQKANVLEGCEHHLEASAIIGRSKLLHVRKIERRTDVTKQPRDLMPCDSSGTLDTLVEKTALSTRSKRSRSLVLPTKFSDSVLQPWKRTRRKK